MKEANYDVVLQLCNFVLLVSNLKQSYKNIRSIKKEQKK